MKHSGSIWEVVQHWVVTTEKKCSPGLILGAKLEVEKREDLGERGRQLIKKA